MTPNHLTDWEYFTFIDALKPETPLLQCAAHLMLYCGLRVNETRTLRWRDVMPSGSPAKGIKITKTNSKNNRTRIVPVPTEMTTTLSSLFRTQCHPSALDENDYLLAGMHRHRPITVRTIQRFIKQIGLDSIGRTITPHTLRHTFATRLYRVSNLRITQDALGHKSIRSTQIYTHVSMADVSQAIERATQPTYIHNPNNALHHLTPQHTETDQP